MRIQDIISARSLGLAAAATMAVGLASTVGAGALPAADSSLAPPLAPADAPARTASVANDTLSIIGTSGADAVALRLAPGSPNTLLVDFGQDGTPDFSFDRTTFSHIAVFLGAGDDDFRSGGGFPEEALVVDAGNGNDTIVGGDGDDLIFGGGGRDTIVGGRGNDTEIMGAGDDVSTWNPGDGSDSVDGGTGKDTLVFNGSNASEKMSLSANGTRALFTRDVGNIRMDMNDVEALQLSALGGTDTISVGDLSGTGFRQVALNLAASAGGADGQADVVTLNGTSGGDNIRVAADGGEVTVRGLSVDAEISGSERADQLQIEGLGGDDTFRVGSGVAALFSVHADL
ncbi:MAG: Ca binding protein [Acidimicrobiia bacterium]|nr:Ca binding protein [Acidimicrobiia bacterium]